MSTILASRIYTKEELCLLEQVPEPCAIVIFGASGDLAQRKLLPSLLHLFVQNLLPKNFYVVGVGRTAMTADEFQEKVRAAVSDSISAEKVRQFVDHCQYVTGDYASLDLYHQLSQALRELDQKYNVKNNRIFYLSTPPSLYGDIVARLGESRLAKPQRKEDEGWVRVVIEKPFGSSLASAIELNKKIQSVLSENQIYRIDHYLAKETVQNIFMFRFANILFEPVWNRNYIDHIQITAAEQVGVEHRAGYYEQSGVLRDMFQNHLLQLLALIAMEPPVNLEANAVRNRRMDIFRSICPLSKMEIEQNTICAQYTDGHIDGHLVPGYRQEKGVDPKSRTATFAAVRLKLDTWRWDGVPFYIRSGKRMAERCVEISIHFKHVPVSIFKPLAPTQLSPNVLKFRIQPDEGITIQFETKHPGPKLCMSTVSMNFGYEETFKTPPPESYARLFLDAMLGDQTLFARSDGVEESWRIIDPIVNFWESDPYIQLWTYPAGSWGPKEADSLLAHQGREWDLRS